MFVETIAHENKQMFVETIVYENKQVFVETIVHIYMVCRQMVANSLVLTITYHIYNK